MKTWNEYKDYIKSIDDTSKEDIEGIESLASLATGEKGIDDI